MTETLDQKIGKYVISAPLSNSSGRLSLRENKDERKTWSTLHRAPKEALTFLSYESMTSLRQGE